MNVDYLIDAVNQMMGILEVSIQPNRKTRQGELVQCAKIGCDTLIRLSNDRAFYRDVQLLADRRLENGAAFLSIAEDMVHFLHHFLVIEERILSEGGASPVVVKVLMLEAERISASVQDADFDMQAVKTHIERLQAISCNIARVLLTRQAQDIEKEAHRQSLKSVAFSIGGAAIIGLNASTGLLSPAGSGTSGALGMEMMKSNLAKILDKKNG